MARSRIREWMRAQVGQKFDGCLMWPFSRTWTGYGQVSYERRIQKAHRVMCIMAHGEPPSPTHVAAHSCGRGQDGCVNPDHLAWKTPAENQLDRRAHGTNRRSTNWSRYNKKVSDDMKLKIRRLKGKKNQREIAAIFGISYQQVSLVQRGLTRQPRSSR